MWFLYFIARINRFLLRQQTLQLSRTFTMLLKSFFAFHWAITQLATDPDAQLETEVGSEKKLE